MESKHLERPARHGHTSFVLRVWEEPSARHDEPSTGEPALRGSIYQVSSGALRHFASLHDLGAIIAAAFEPEAAPRQAAPPRGTDR